MQADTPSTQPTDTETAAAVRDVYQAELERRRKRNIVATMCSVVAVIVAAIGFMVWKNHADDATAKREFDKGNCEIFNDLHPSGPPVDCATYHG